MIELGELPVVEDAEVVELLLDRARHARELLEVVGGAARTGETLEAAGSRRKIFGDRLGGGADVDARLALTARDAVDRRARDEVAIQRDGAPGVVIAGDDIGDALRVRIGVDDRGDRNICLLYTSDAADE